MSYNNINKIMVTFIQNPRDPDVHTHLNNIYSDFLPNPEKLFIDEDSWDTLKDDPALEIYRQIIDMICTQAIQTDDMTVIPPLVKMATLNVRIGNHQIYLQ